MFIYNAKITSTSLGVEDHGILTAFLYLEFDGSSSQGFGGFALDSDGDGYRRGGPFCAEFIRQVLETVGANDWKDLRGALCRIEKESWGGPILGIGNILEDRWFRPKKWLEEHPV